MVLPDSKYLHMLALVVQIHRQVDVEAHLEQVCNLVEDWNQMGHPTDIEVVDSPQVFGGDQDRVRKYHND